MFVEKDSTVLTKIRKLFGIDDRVIYIQKVRRQLIKMKNRLFILHWHCLPMMPNASALLDLPVTVCSFKVILITWLNGVMFGRWLLTWINARFAQLQGRAIQ